MEPAISPDVDAPPSGVAAPSGCGDNECGAGGATVPEGTSQLSAAPSPATTSTTSPNPQHESTSPTPTGGPGTDTAPNIAANKSADLLGYLGVRPVPTSVRSWEDPDQCRREAQDFFALALGSERREATGDGGGAKGRFRAFYDGLLGTFDPHYAKEVDFSAALFEKMASGLKERAVTEAEDCHQGRPKTYRSVVVTSGNCIVLEPSRRACAFDSSPSDALLHEYATGLVREEAHDPDERGGDGRRRPMDVYHAWAVFRRPAGSDDARWEVWKMVAVVKLARRGRGDCVIEGMPPASMDGDVSLTSLASLGPDRQGPIAEAVVDTLYRGILRETAALGVLPERIPFATLDCKLCEESKMEDLARGWAHGHLVVPAVCGFGYAFDVDAFGSIRDEKGANDAPLAAYLQVMAHGLRMAGTWLDGLAENDDDQMRPQRPTSLPAQHPMSGRALHFGTGHEIVPASALRQALVASTVSTCGNSRMSAVQGELFEATVNLRQLRSTTLDRVFWCRQWYHEENVQLVIKVSSRSCFDPLVPIVATYFHLISVFPKLWRHHEMVREVLSPSLYGVYATPGESGLVQLLPNLQALRFEKLCPGTWLNADSWSALWEAFSGFVTRVLLPLADNDIVHADIRAGYDATSSVLYHPTAGSMRLIELDSLCHYRSLARRLFLSDQRFIDVRNLPPVLQTARARGYVLSQVLCVAESWLRETVDAAVNANNLIHEAAASSPALSIAEPVDRALIDAVLAEYTPKMSSAFGRRRGPATLAP